MVGALHGGLEWDFANAWRNSIGNPAGVGCIGLVGVWCLLGHQVVPMAVGWPIKGVGHCTKGTASNPFCTSGMGEKLVRMPY